MSALSNHTPRGSEKWTSTPHPRLSFNLRLIPGVTMMFPEGDFGQRLATARSHGFRGVEGGIPENVSELRRALEAEGMFYVCLSAGRGPAEADAFGMAAIPGREAAFKDEIRKGIEAASALGCSMIHAVGGLVPDDARDQCEGLYLKNLEFACELAAKSGIQILIEPICAVRQPRYILHTHAKALDIILAIGADNIGLMADMYHGRMAGEDMADFVRKNAALIPLFQVADTPVRRQPEEADSELRDIFDHLAKADWQGWISGEYVMEGALEDALKWTAPLRDWQGAPAQ